MAFSNQNARRRLSLNQRRDEAPPFTACVPACLRGRLHSFFKKGIRALKKSRPLFEKRSREVRAGLRRAFLQTLPEAEDAEMGGGDRRDEVPAVLEADGAVAQEDGRLLKAEV